MEINYHVLTVCGTAEIEEQKAYFHGKQYEKYKQRGVMGVLEQLVVQV